MCSISDDGMVVAAGAEAEESIFLFLAMYEYNVKFSRTFSKCSQSLINILYALYCRTNSVLVCEWVH